MAASSAPTLLPKSDKQVALEDHLEKLTEALGNVEDVATEIRNDQSIDIVNDQLGHYLTHQSNIVGEFRVMMGQLRDLISREDAKRTPPADDN